MLRIVCFLILAISLIWPYRNCSVAEEITLTEEQKQELQKALQEKLEKIKESLQKVKTLSDMQNSQAGGSSAGSQVLPSPGGLTGSSNNTEPEWDGIYILTAQNKYIEAKPLRSGGGKLMRSSFSMSKKKYLDLTLYPDEINFIQWEDFKGILFKGPQILSPIKIGKLTSSSSALGLDKVLLFLEGARGGSKFTVDDLDVNLHASDMRCRTRTDAAYCEFEDREKVLRYISESNDKPCILVAAGESGKGRMSAICFGAR